MTDYQIFTIGHGGHTLDTMINQLLRLHIEFVIDVRSIPYSRYQPEFSKDSLTRALTYSELRYGSMGRQLGGRPDDPSCYTENGNVDYDKCKQRPFFQKGILRLQNACRLGHRVCLLCSEGDPKDCHRSVLIGEALTDIGIRVIHVFPDGSSKSQSEVMQERTGGQFSFFGQTSRKSLQS